MIIIARDFEDYFLRVYAARVGCVLRGTFVKESVMHQLTKDVTSRFV